MVKDINQKVCKTELIIIEYFIILQYKNNEEIKGGY